MNHNPYLKPWHRVTPEKLAGKGAIEKPGEGTNIEWQTRVAPPTDYENALADALIESFETGIESLPALAAALNQRNIHAPDGTPWTEQNLATELARLGN